MSGCDADRRRELERRWAGDWSELGVTPAHGTFEQVLAAWDEPWRAYHTSEHLLACLRELDGARGQATRPAEVALALWFHDAVYDPKASDNEARSARWAAEVLADAGAPPATVDRVVALIDATRHDATPPGPDAALLVDVDLAILGAPEPAFERYEAQVRQEYAWVAEQAFREGRSRILRGFLDRGRIYATEGFHARLEDRARGNLRRALRGLQG